MLSYRCTANDTAWSRGRIPAHEVSLLKKIILHEREDEERLMATRSRYRKAGLPYKYWKCRENIALSTIQTCLIKHCTSYDKVTRPAALHGRPPMTQPLQELTPYKFYYLVGFWPEQFRTICECLTLLPERIRTHSRCIATREEGLFLLLLRWKHVASWENAANEMRRGRSWCITIYRAFFALCAKHYRKCVKIIDYRRILPLLESWSATLQAHIGASPDTAFFADGKPWKMSRPGTGQAAKHFARVAGVNDVNLVQRAYYNGHYRFHGAKVQHVVEADSIIYSFVCPIRRHDSAVLRLSSMLLQLSCLYVNGDPNRPAKTILDKAYGRTPHFRPLHTQAELDLMQPDARVAAIFEDKQNRKPRMSTEHSFNLICSKFCHTDYFRYHRILQQGKSNWKYMHIDTAAINIQS